MRLLFTGPVLVLSLVTGVPGLSPSQEKTNSELEAQNEVKEVRYSMPVNKRLTPLAQWSGYVFNPALRTAAPENHILTNAMKWEMLWKTWKGGQEIPGVNFKEEVLFVFTSHGPNIPCLQLYSTGLRVTGNVGHTLRGGQGFGYQIWKVPRKEAKSLFGQPIE